MIWPEDPLLELSQEVVKLKMEISHIDTDLLKVIGDCDVKEIMTLGAGKIKTLVETKQQVWKIYFTINYINTYILFSPTIGC